MEYTIQINDNPITCTNDQPALSTLTLEGVGLRAECEALQNMILKAPEQQAEIKRLRDALVVIECHGNANELDRRIAREALKEK